MRLTRTARGAAAAGICAVLMVGCTGAWPGSPVARSPSPTGWGPDLSAEEAFTRIPLAGTDQVPLHWEVPDFDTEDVAEAVLAARRFQALSVYRYSQPAPDAEAYLYQWVATDRMIGVRFPDGPPDPDRPNPGQSRGPAWLRVLDTEQVGAAQVRVTICQDLGWLGEVDGSVDLPRHDRARHRHYAVVEQRPVDGSPHWLVNQVWAEWELVGAALRHECEEWATHDPEEA